MAENSKYKFYETYINDLFPILSQFELMRKKILMQLIALMLLCFLIGYLGFLLRGYDANFGNPLFHSIMVLAPTVGFCLIYPYKVFFKNELKRNCLPAIHRCSKNITWNYQFDKSLIKRSKLFDNYDEVYFDDIFMMKYNGVKFNVADVMLYIMSDDKHKKPDQNCILFSGAIINIPTNKKIKAETLIFSKEPFIKMNLNTIFFTLELFFIIIYLYSHDVIFIILNIIILILYLVYCMINYKKCDKHEFKRVSLEDPVFNKKFTVYSKNQVEARYLLTTSFIDRLNNLKVAFKTNNIRCAFFDDNVMFALKTNIDLFELGNLFTPLTEPKNFDKFYNQIMSIYQMIDYFKLDQKTGL